MTDVYVIETDRLMVVRPKHVLDAKTVEKIIEQDLLADPMLSAGTLPGFYVESVAVAPRGAWPLPLPDHYAWDENHLAEYARLAATEEGFATYLDRYVYEKRAA